MGRCVADAAELAAVYEAIGTSLRRFLLGVTKDLHAAEDAAQAAFAKAMEARPQGAPEALRAWFFKVALNEALARRRTDKRFQEIAKDLAWLRDSAPRSESTIEDREAIERIHEEVERLPREQRQVLHKRLVEGKKFVEIAREERLPLGTVLTRMRLALERLRGRLGDDL